MDDSRPPQPGPHDHGHDQRPSPGGADQNHPGDERRPGWQHAAATTRDAARGTARATARAGRATRRTIRRATNAQGAGETGLSKLTELSGVNAAGDALVAVSLAGSLFFSVPIGEARGRVALYLVITMVPFAILAPLIGPLLDKFRSGRRYALAVTFGLRGFLAWSMVGSVDDADLWLYPAVFGVLVSNRAYGVTRAACVPRLLPPSVPLVRANSWMNMAGLLSAAVAAGVGVVVVHVLGAPWALRIAAIVFVTGAVLSLRLPKRVDSAVDERRATLTGESVAAAATAAEAPKGLRAGLPKVRVYVGPSVEMGLRANMAFRAVSGFLTLFLAFYLRQEPIGNLSDTTAIGLVIGSAGVGSVIGTSVGALIRERAPEGMLVLLLMAETAALLLSAVWWGLFSVLLAGFVTGFAQTLGKLALDAMIQRDVEEDVRTSAFARSETWLQMAWVSGGALGIALPLRGDVGFGIASGAMIVLTAVVVQGAANARKTKRRDPDGTRARPLEAESAPPGERDGPAQAHRPDTVTKPYQDQKPPDPTPQPGTAAPGASQPVPRSGPLHPGFRPATPPAPPVALPPTPVPPPAPVPPPTPFPPPTPVPPPTQFPPTQFPPTQFPPPE